MEKARILIVEDEAIVAEDLENMITEIGYDVIGRAVSANDAINGAIELEPDLILMDIVLKGEKNGIDASLAIKEKLDIPIIFLTAYSDIGLLDRAKTTEPYAYIVKPFQERQLLASIEMSLYKNKMEKRLKNSEERLRSIAENALEWIWEVDTNGKYIYTSPSIEKVIGYKPRDVLNKYFFDFFHDDTREKDKKMLFELFNKQWPFREFVKKNIHKSGQPIWLLSSGVPMLDTNGDLLGYRGTDIDITEEVRSKENLRQAVSDLTHLNTDLERITCAVSYDLIKPLNLVTDNVKLLTSSFKDMLNDNAQKNIICINQGIDQIKMLIDDLLIYSYEGIQKKEFVPTSCAMVLDRVLINLQTLIKENDVVVTYNYLPTLLADDTNLARLFEKLIANAIKLRSEEPLHVHISAEQKENEWLFTVHGNGIYIDPQFIKHIFTVFQPLSDIEKYTGGCIGLAVCKRIVEGYGGKIWMESNPGKGFTIFFTIPINNGI
jgi:PAS domain S-box-containing protein